MKSVRCCRHALRRWLASPCSIAAFQHLGAICRPTSALSLLAAHDFTVSVPPDPGIADKPRQIGEVEHQVGIGTLVFEDRVARNMGDAEVKERAVTGVGCDRKL